jgi:hypothetical protein
MFVRAAPTVARGLSCARARVFRRISLLQWCKAHSCNDAMSACVTMRIDTSLVWHAACNAWRPMARQVEFGDRNGGFWGSVSKGRKGWTVMTFSRWSGSRTGVVVFVPFDAPGILVKPTDNLNAPYNECMTNADAIRAHAGDHCAGCRVFRRGNLVQ